MPMYVHTFILRSSGLNGRMRSCAHTARCPPSLRLRSGCTATGCSRRAAQSLSTMASLPANTASRATGPRQGWQGRLRWRGGSGVLECCNSAVGPSKCTRVKPTPACACLTMPLPLWSAVLAGSRRRRRACSQDRGSAARPRTHSVTRRRGSSQGATGAGGRATCRSGVSAHQPQRQRLTRAAGGGAAGAGGATGAGGVGEWLAYMLLGLPWDSDAQ